MAPPGGKDLQLTIYGLDVHGVEVEASVFADKLKRVISALKRLDAHYNAQGQHKFMINGLEFQSATVFLREKTTKPKAIRRSPSQRFAEIGFLASSGADFIVQNAADEFALGTYESLAKGAGENFSYGVVSSPAVDPVRIDTILGRRVHEIVARATTEAERAPKMYFKGSAIETYDGTMKVVDLRGLFPEAKLVLSAGGKEISCVVPVDEVEMLRNSLGRRVLVKGRAVHDGRSMLPERINVTSIKVIESSVDIIELRGALRGLDPTFLQGGSLIG